LCDKQNIPKTPLRKTIRSLYFAVIFFQLSDNADLHRFFSLKYTKSLFYTLFCTVILCASLCTLWDKQNIPKTPLRKTLRSLFSAVKNNTQHNTIKAPKSTNDEECDATEAAMKNKCSYHKKINNGY
jgi:hypothetical protein